MTHPDGCAGVPDCPECSEQAMLEGFRGDQPEPRTCPCCGQALPEPERAVEAV